MAFFARCALGLRKYTLLVLGSEGKEKWQATHIAPLQPPILAAFRPWGDSAGAGRVRPAGAKIRKQGELTNGAIDNLQIL